MLSRAMTRNTVIFFFVIKRWRIRENINIVIITGAFDAEVKRESNTHGDILQDNFLDSYGNLTLKSLFSLK